MGDPWLDVIDAAGEPDAGPDPWLDVIERAAQPDEPDWEQTSAALEQSALPSFAMPEAMEAPAPGPVPIDRMQGLKAVVEPIGARLETESFPDIDADELFAEAKKMVRQREARKAGWGNPQPPRSRAGRAISRRFIKPEQQQREMENFASFARSVGMSPEDLAKQNYEAGKRGLEIDVGTQHWAVRQPKGSLGKGGGEMMFDAPYPEKTFPIGKEGEPSKVYVQPDVTGRVPSPTAYEYLGAPIVAFYNLTRAIKEGEIADVISPPKTEEEREQDQVRADLHAARPELSGLSAVLGAKPIRYPWESDGPVGGLGAHSRPIPGPSEIKERAFKGPSGDFRWPDILKALGSDLKTAQTLPKAVAQLGVAAAWTLFGPDPLAERFERIKGAAKAVLEYIPETAKKLADDPVGYIEKHGFISAGLDIALPFTAVRSAAARIAAKKMRYALVEAGDRIPFELRKLLDGDDVSLLEGLRQFSLKHKEAKKALATQEAEFAYGATRVARPTEYLAGEASEIRSLVEQRKRVRAEMERIERDFTRPEAPYSKSIPALDPQVEKAWDLAHKAGIPGYEQTARIRAFEEAAAKKYSHLELEAIRLKKEIQGHGGWAKLKLKERARDVLAEREAAKELLVLAQEHATRMRRAKILMSRELSDIIHSERWWGAVRDVAEKGGRLVNPAWGPFEMLNMTKNKLISGEGTLLGAEKAYLRHLFRDPYNAIPQFVHADFREAQMLVDDVAFAMRDMLIKIPEQHRPTVRELSYFEHESVTRNFNRAVDPETGIVRYSLKEGVKATDALRQKLSLAQKYSEPLALQIRRKVTDLGLEADAFEFAEAIMKRAWMPQVYKQGGPDALFEAVHHQVVGSALMQSKLRRKGIPIEARETPLGTPISKSIIDRAPEEVKVRIHGTDKFETYHPRQDMRGRNNRGEGGYGMSTDFADNLLTAVPDAVRDFANMRMFKRWSKDPRVHSEVMRPGWKEAPKGPRGEAKWPGLTGHVNPDVYYYLTKTEEYAHWHKTWMGRLIGNWKAFKTIDSPSTHGTNILGNGLGLAPAAGISPLNPRNAMHYLPSVRALLKGPDDLLYKQWVLDGGRGLRGVAGRADDLSRTAEKATAKMAKGWFGAHKNFLIEVRKDILTGKFISSGKGAARGYRTLQRHAGAMYQSEDAVFRIALYHKELLSRGGRVTGKPSAAGAAAAQRGLEAFAHYENMAGFFNLVRSSWAGFVAPPFMAFDVKAFPQVVKFAREKPHLAIMYDTLSEYLTHQNMAISGGDMSAHDELVRGLPWYQESTSVPWNAINPYARLTARGGIQFWDVGKYSAGVRFFPLVDELRRWNIGEGHANGFSNWWRRVFQGGNPVLTSYELFVHNYSPFFNKADLTGDEVRRMLLEQWLPNFPLLPYSYSWNRIEAAKANIARSGREGPETTWQSRKATWLGIKNLDFTVTELIANGAKKSKRLRRILTDIRKIDFSVQKEIKAFRVTLAGKGIVKSEAVVAEMQKRFAPYHLKAAVAMDEVTAIMKEEMEDRDIESLDFMKYYLQ